MLNWPHYSDGFCDIRWIDGFVIEVVAYDDELTFLDSSEFKRELDIRILSPSASDGRTGALVVDWQHDLLHTGVRRPVRLSPVSGGAFPTENERDIEFARALLHNIRDVSPTLEAAYYIQQRGYLGEPAPRLAGGHANPAISNHDALSKAFPETLAGQLVMVVSACLRDGHPAEVKQPRRFSFRVRPDLLYSISSETFVGLVYPPSYTDDSGSISFFSRKCSLDDLHAGTALARDLETALTDTLNGALVVFSECFNANPLIDDVVSVVAYDNQVRIFDMWPVPRSAQTVVRQAASCIRIGRKDLSATAVLRLTPDVVQKVALRRLEYPERLNLLTFGVSGAPGAVSGIPCMDLADVEKAQRRGVPAVLFAEEPNPDLLPAILAAEGLVFRRGGATSHVAVIARGIGKAAIFGAGQVSVDQTSRRISVGKLTLAADSWVSVDGVTARLYEGYCNVTDGSGIHQKDLSTIIEWCSRQAVMKVYANADSNSETRVAIAAGAKGVGLCRLEHLLSRPDYLRSMQSAIAFSWLSRTYSQNLWTAKIQLRSWPGSEAAAAHVNLEEKLFSQLDIGQSMQRALSSIGVGLTSELEAIFVAASGRPVVVRLLDPPISEFLDHRLGNQIVAAFGEVEGNDLRELIDARNPMLGLRGVRLGLLFPELTKVQVTAICQAAMRTARALKIQPKASILLPMVVDPSEVDEMRKIIDSAVNEVDPRGELKLSVGAMIETPRAALVAGSIAERSDFLSIGTNDLTQFVWACSRDTADTDFLTSMPYRSMIQSPFKHLDETGVGRLIRLAISDARRARPDIEIGICGEQVTDVASLQFLADVGATYVSCASSNVYVTQLLVAQAAFRASDQERCISHEN